ncbi:MAG: branched-chain-amino-acid transaminase [Anaerolineae bacterium]
MTHLVCYVNGQYLPLKEAGLPVQDLAILRGYGVFDFLRTYNGQPFRLAEHLQRLARSAALIELELPWSLAEIEQIVRQTLARNVLPEANIRIVVTGGVSANSVTPDDGPGLLVLVTPAHRYPADYYTHGAKVITVPSNRYIPDAKTINYMAALMAQKKARAAGAVEALYLSEQGHVLEGTTSNLFVFKGEQLVTPVEGILPGITRAVVLELAREMFEVVEQPLLLADLPAIDEAFICASNKEIMPLHTIDDSPVGSGGAPGPNTQRLMERFRAFTRGS